MNLITQAQLAEWLDGLARQRTLIAPHEVAGILLYRPVESSQEIAWGFGRTVMSVKEAFFPPTERLLTIQKSDGGIELIENLPEGEQVIFGVRPCDARGVKILDALFLNKEPVDPYYARRRANTTLVGLACKEMGPTCFCTSVGGAPDEASDMDVMLYEVEGGYAFEAVTDKGKALVSNLQFTSDDRDRPAPIINPQSATCGERSRTIPNPQSISWPAHFTSEYWPRMSERCLSCRACTYVCPTCRCFIIRDEVLPYTPGEPAAGAFERIRCWDSCEGENYRRIAGGHRQRAEKSERLRNRFFCKFYYYPEQYGLGTASACTGCGRCVDVCPVGVDITEMLMEVGR